MKNNESIKMPLIVVIEKKSIGDISWNLQCIKTTAVPSFCPKRLMQDTMI